MIFCFLEIIDELCNNHTENMAAVLVELISQILPENVFLEIYKTIREPIRFPL